MEGNFEILIVPFIGVVFSGWFGHKILIVTFNAINITLLPNRRLSIEEGPIPQFGMKKIQLNDISEVSIEESVEHSHDIEFYERNGVEYHYKIKVLSKENNQYKWVKIYNCTNFNKALFLAQTIQEYFGLPQIISVRDKNWSP